MAGRSGSGKTNLTFVLIKGIMARGVKVLAIDWKRAYRDMLRLQDDRLLMSYGYRRKPYGNQARLSEDGGRTWSEPITLSGEPTGRDLGYPSTAQLDDGTLVSVWYEQRAVGERDGSGDQTLGPAALRMLRWRVG